MMINPYTSVAGAPPNFLAGRDELLKQADEALEYIRQGYCARSIVYYGLRGVGKTVMLNRLEDMAEDKNIDYEQLEISERGYFKAEIALRIFKLIRKLSRKTTQQASIDKAFSVLKSFALQYDALGSESIFSQVSDVTAAVGVADTGDFTNDLTELLLAVGTAAKKAACGVVLFFDEVQFLHDEEFAALLAAIHRINQKALPLLVLAAGLPKIAKFANDAKSYAERLLSFVELGSLDAAAGAKALTEPAARWGVTYTEEALQKILQATECYPYFLQEYGRLVWQQLEPEQPVITAQMAEQAYPAFEQSLDEGFFKLRYDRATPRELEFMLAMVNASKLPCPIKEVEQQLDCPTSALSPLRAQLIHKGFIYAPQRGEVAFTVPQFAQFLRRRHSIS